MWSMEAILARILWIGRNYQRWKRKLPMLSEQDVYPSPYMTRHILGCTSPTIEFPSLPNAPLFHMVGPAAVPPNDSEAIDQDLQNWLQIQRHSSKRRIIYVAFGTMYKYTKERVRHLEKELMKLEDVAVIWSLPQENQAYLKCEPPEHWYVRQFFPQVSLFENGTIDAFVTHCGSNSVYEALLSGVPMVCCPSFADQPANATRLARIGVAEIAARKGNVAEALHQLLDDDIYNKIRETSTTIADQLKSNDAAAHAATLIENVVRGKMDDDDVEAKKQRLPWWPVFLGLCATAIFL